MKEIAWGEQEPEYAEAVKADIYHRLRLEFVEALLPSLSGAKARIVDFGCGEGVLSSRLAKSAGAGAEVIGIDPSPELIALAKKSSTQENLEYQLGSVEKLKQMPSDSTELVLVINVLAYMSPDEESEFYTEARRILRPGASLVVTHSNELFDMFTLNNLTIEFFARHFRSEIGPLLSELSNKTMIETYGIRENPIAYIDKLASLGFVQEEIRFFHNHPVPPLLQVNGEKRNTVNQELEESALSRVKPIWTDFFTCSTFGVRAIKS